jgi:hypothetical protein
VLKGGNRAVESMKAQFCGSLCTPRGRASLLCVHGSGENTVRCDKAQPECGGCRDGRLKNASDDSMGAHAILPKIRRSGRSYRSSGRRMLQMLRNERARANAP